MMAARVAIFGDQIRAKLRRSTALVSTLHRRQASAGDHLGSSREDRRHFRRSREASR
jgi:hypothetical protein